MSKAMNSVNKQIMTKTTSPVIEILETVMKYEGLSMQEWFLSFHDKIPILTKENFDKYLKKLRKSDLTPK